MVSYKTRYLLILICLLAETSHFGRCILKRRHPRNIGGNYGRKAINAPLLGDEIDLESIEGIEQVTKLVLIKTDSLPSDSNERIDGRYLNSLMETLYTGLRKPFKSVSADILGIFPSFEEIQVRCDRQNLQKEHIERDESDGIKRRRSSSESQNISSIRQDENSTDDISKFDERKNETISSENDSNYITQTYHKSSLEVCQAVTSDCLSMDNLVRVLPPTMTTFDKVLVRLCPIMLFRIMNDLCQKSSSSLANDHQDEIKEEVEVMGQNPKRDSITLNTLIRESKILKNLQSSEDFSQKKPQKLHKKLKTQTTYKANRGLNAGGLQPHGSVDEQLLKIRLKLTEPSIEKVWIFSLLFVILSIVVSMGGLIVLPFVKKTTRRRILTLFEGLAVGGLAGSATLHMFPQAFGLVDENYHKYFWRIFVVFFGIYLCYLCERIIKIMKVMKAKIKRRSRASLVDMDFYYGYPSINHEVGKNRSRSSRFFSDTLDYDQTNQSYMSKKRLKNSTSKDHDLDVICKDHFGDDSIRSKDKPCKSTKKMKKEMLDSSLGLDETRLNENTELETNSTRQRLVQCLKSVQQQFSPVYAVQTQNLDGTTTSKDEPRAGRFVRSTSYQEKPSKKSRLQESKHIFKRGRGEGKQSMKKYLKRRDIETMLYHRGMESHKLHREINLDREYNVQPRLSRVNDVAAERQDQDNAARMSVDTVAWMIVFGDAVLNVIDGLSIGAAFERNILAGISISVAVMLEEVTHRLGTFAVLIRAGMSMQQSLLCTFLSACALFPGLIVGILLSDATEDATPYIFCAAGGIFLYMVSR